MKAFKFSIKEIRKISEDFKNETGIDPLANNRLLHNVLARHCISHILYYDYKEPHCHIGFLTNRDRTSSNHSVRTIDEQISIKNREVIELRRKIKEVFILNEKKHIWREEASKVDWMSSFSESVSEQLQSRLSKEDSILFLRDLIFKFENAEWN